MLDIQFAMPVTLTALPNVATEALGVATAIPFI